MCVCVLQLTSFEELGVQVRQAAGDGVSQAAAADPVVGLDAQVATQRALKTTVMGGGERCTLITSITLKVNTEAVKSVFHIRAGTDRPRPPGPVESRLTQQAKQVKYRPVHERPEDFTPHAPPHTSPQPFQNLNQTHSQSNQ